jgi:Polyketide cyclase / dehydrase and lipid transport
MNEHHSFMDWNMDEASGTNAAFSHTRHTSAPAERIWALWTDPSSWADWDGGLKSATLSGVFQEGAEGVIIANNGTKSSFRVGVCIKPTSTVFTTRLPFARLVILRSLTVQNGDVGTNFTHHVSFSGILGWFWAFALGRGFRKELPKTMERLARMAEETTS